MVSDQRTETPNGVDRDFMFEKSHLDNARYGQFDLRLFQTKDDQLWQDMLFYLEKYCAELYCKRGSKMNDLMVL